MDRLPQLPPYQGNRVPKCTKDTNIERLSTSQYMLYSLNILLLKELL